MSKHHIALMIYGDINSERNALTEDKYKDLGNAFKSEGFEVESVLYNDELAEKLAIFLLKFDAILVWVNPIEQGTDRKKLDSLLIEISNKGHFVATHPEVILKIGTKEVLYKTKDMSWGGDTKIYTGYEDFVTRFHESLRLSGIRVLKKYRGNGGNGVYKIIHNVLNNEVTVIHAIASNEAKVFSLDDFYSEFKPFFLNDGLLIDQEWNKNTVNGMVRCYLSGTKVAGFGYQEINALYELNTTYTKSHLSPSKRYYFTENCGLFNDLKEIMESIWVPQLQNIVSITKDMLPVIWDADFFINNIDNKSAIGKYTL